MVYIHTLRDLTIKTAEIDSIELIRELKRTTVLPFSEENMNNSLMTYFISDRDKELMKNALSLIAPTITQIQDIAKRKDPLYEAINLVRALEMLNELIEPISGNIMYAEDTNAGKGSMIRELVYVFNGLPRARTREEKIVINDKLNEVFKKILRKEDFGFNEAGVIGEGELKKIRTLNESMTNGYFFHVTLEEEIKKQNFANIKDRIPANELNEYYAIAKNIEDIRNGIERAYENNMRMVNLALLLYSHIKMLRKP